VRSDDEGWAQKELEKAAKRINDRDGFSLQLHGGFVRQPKVLSKANHRLIEMITQCGRDLDMRVEWRHSGGCCDGNNLASAGLPNVDNLGVRGGNIHSDQEYMHLESLTERAKLSALFLMKLSSGDLKWMNNEGP
jgi:glutamate carboxypeptidase